MPNKYGHWTYKEYVDELYRYNRLYGAAEPSEITVRRIVTDWLSSDPQNGGARAYTPVLSPTRPLEDGYGVVSVPWSRLEVRDDKARLVLEQEVYTQLRALGWRF